MAELIDKKSALNALSSASYGNFNYVTARNAIDCIRTTTESEIRAKAIDEFEKEIVAEYDNDGCPNVTDYLDYKISLRDLFRIADELKGGAD